MTRRILGIILLGWLLLSLFAGPVGAQQTGSGPIIVLEVRGVINPLTTQYLTRTLGLAQQRDARLVVISIDTPGGLETAMREMSQLLLNSPIPTVVYVEPAGARATSAGLFITLSGHVAAMAPATHIGAAHPVPLGADIDEVMDEKATSDAAALVRSIAAVRDRNTEWPERAVRENLSLTAQEALEENVIDLVAENLDALLAQLDGRSVTTERGPVTIQTAGAVIERHPMNLAERLMHVITEPNIAYLLLSLGTLFLLAELTEPGLGLPGIASAVSFIIAFLALGSLPVNWAGIALLAVAVVFFAVGIFTDTEAIVSVAGLVPFVLGSLLLFSPFTSISPAMPDLSVSPWLIGTMAAAILGFTFLVLRAVLKAVRLPPQTGAERLVGAQGTARSDLAPDGQVRVNLEDWSAVSVSRPIKAGEAVRVIGIAGVRLQVVPVEPEEPAQGGS
ncbi:MAG TPA: nodulation protein NfeD [Chloroflexi bacterium]|nr:nodulation protein NfeD [Chloroflexota bacterium]